MGFASLSPSYKAHLRLPTNSKSAMIAYDDVPAPE